MIQFFAVVLPALILFCGLSIDIGMLELRKLQMQSAADAAAIGAVLEAERGTGNWVTVGQAEAGINGFTNGTNNTTVTLTQRANYGAYNGHWDTLQATITQNVHTIFMGALNGGVFSLTAQASALTTPCVYLMGTGTLQNYNFEQVTGSTTGDTCSMYMNTNLYVPSAGQVAVQAVDVAGSPGSSSVSGFVFPGPLYNVPAMTDPLASITSPAFGSCNHSGFSVTSGIVTLSPGTYCKGLNLSYANVTLSPGLYIITGGATWNHVTVTGSGVTLFFTQGGGGGYGQFNIQNSTVTLSASNDGSNGTTTAVVVFADRNWTATGAQDFQFTNSTVQGDGIWYLKKAGLYIWSCGNFTGPHYLGIVADNVYFGGVIVTPTNNYSYVTTGNPFRRLGSLVQ